MIGTQGQIGGLAEALFSKNRRAVLSLLYGHADEAFYLRQIVRASGGGVAQSNGNFGNWLKAGLFGVPPMVSRSTSKPVPSARCLPS